MNEFECDGDIGGLVNHDDISAVGVGGLFDINDVYETEANFDVDNVAITYGSDAKGKFVVASNMEGDDGVEPAQGRDLIVMSRDSILESDQAFSVMVINKNVCMYSDDNVYDKGHERPDGFSTDVESIVRELTSLGGSDRDLFVELLFKYRTLFSSKPGCVNHYQHVIKLNKAVPFIKRSYLVPLTKKNAVAREMADMLKDGIIEQSNSPFCSPISRGKER